MPSGKHILDSGVLAMDEVPIKAGVKKGAGRIPGQMKQTYFWPMYGEQDEVAFTWSSGRAMAHAIEQLNGFVGILLTDGYRAYTQAVARLNVQEVTVVHANCWAHCRRTFEKALIYEPEGRSRRWIKLPNCIESNSLSFETMSSIARRD